MKKNLSRLLSFVLVLLMVMTALPVSAGDAVKGGSELSKFGKWLVKPTPIGNFTHPAQNFTAELEDGTVVTVNAPVGALPAKTRMTAQAINNMEAVQAAVDQTDGVTGTVLTAVDITFTKGNTEVQPRKDVKVTISSDALAGMDDLSVVHLDVDADELEGSEDAEPVENAQTNSEGVLFSARHFSVYAVIGDGQTGDKARAKVIFKNVGATESDDSEIASMYIKQDDTPEELKYIVYDPGAGTIATGNMFVGWSLTREFTTDSPRMTIQDVRDWLDQQVIEEGEEFVFYAMIFTVYTISFIGEEGEQTGVKVSLGSDSVIIPTTSENATYKIELDYNPDGVNQHFEGWLASEDTIGNIVSVTVNGQPIDKTGHIPVNAVLTIKGDIKLTVDAPEGYWVIYKENAKGATYIAPDFYPNGTTTVAPTKTPKRYGYDFGGWYTGTEVYDDEGNLVRVDLDPEPYPFNTELNGNVTVYAKWNPHTNAPYTVIIWLQNVSGNGYDYEESIPVESGTVGAVQTAVTETGSGDARKAIVSGMTKSYTGFHLDHYDSDKVIRTEGDTVINVYYNRNEHTFTFRDTGAVPAHYELVANPVYNSNVEYYIADSTESSGYRRVYYDSGFGSYYYQTVVSSYNNLDTSNNSFSTSLYYFNYGNTTYIVWYRNGTWVYGTSQNSYSTFSNSIFNQVTLREQHLVDGPFYEYVAASSSGVQTIHTVTRLYGQDISDIWNFTGDNGVTYPQTNPATSWQPSGSSTYTARITRMEIMPDEDITFTHMTTSNTTRYFYYFVEALDGTAEHDISQLASNQTPREDYHTVRHGTDNKLYILKIYLVNDFNEVYYNDDFFTITGFSRDEITFSNGTHVNALDQEGEHAFWENTLNNAKPSAAANYTLYFFYDRQSSRIIYKDGIYVDGNNNTIALPARGDLHTSDPIPYGTDLASYNKGGGNYYAPVCTAEGYEGFVFEGWYLDPNCTSRATFTDIKDANIVVYAKWRQIQYRVYLQPNMHDNDLDWGEDPTMCFRVNYNGIVELRDGRVPGKFMFLGWWMDEAMKDHPYIEDVTVLNQDIDDQFMEDYDMNVDYTDTYDRYGDLQNPKENSDLTGYDPDPEDDDNPLEPRFWITRKLTLYAKWRAIYDGVDGIQVKYDAVDGENAPDDPLTYLDESEAIARAASRAPEGYVFLYWVLQTWDEDAGEFVDLDADRYYYYPGAKFTVDDANAHLYTENNVTRMEVQLRAEYGKVGAATPTHIYWYSNLKDLNQNAIDKDAIDRPSDAVFEAEKGWRMETSNVYINISYDIISPTTFSVPGYRFIGWARINSETGYEGNSDYTNITMEDLFLKWVEGDGSKDAGHYEAQNDNGDWVKVTKIAADERHSYHDLYAVWQGVFNVYHSGVEGGNVQTYDVPAKKDGAVQTFNLLNPEGSKDGSYNITEGYLYGGYYLEGGFTAPATRDGEIPAYDGTNWTWTTPATVDATAITPEAGQTYYLKEVPDTMYLQPYLHYTYTTADGVIKSMFLFSAVDDLNYLDTGFVVVDAWSGVPMINVASTVTITASNTNTSVTLTPANVFGGNGVRSGYLTYARVKVGNWGDVQLNENNRVWQYWKTPDGLYVTGTTMRTYINLDSAWHIAVETNSHMNSVITSTKVDPSTAQN